MANVNTSVRVPMYLLKLFDTARPGECVSEYLREVTIHPRYDIANANASRIVSLYLPAEEKDQLKELLGKRVSTYYHNALVDAVISTLKEKVSNE